MFDGVHWLHALYVSPSDGPGVYAIGLAVVARWMTVDVEAGTDDDGDDTVQGSVSVVDTIHHIHAN